MDPNPCTNMSSANNTSAPTLQAILDAIQQLNGGIDTLDKQLNGRIDGLDKKFDKKIDDKFDILASEIIKLGLKVDVLNESRLRDHAKNLFGNSFSKSYVMKGLWGAVDYVMRVKKESYGQNYDVLEHLSDKVELLCNNLTNEDKNSFLLWVKEQVSIKYPTLSDCVKSFPDIVPNEIDAIFETIKDLEGEDHDQGSVCSLTTLFESLRVLYFCCSFDQAKSRRSFKSCNGLGFFLLYHKALKVSHASTLFSFPPPSELQFDLRGSISVFESMIHVGAFQGHQMAMNQLKAQCLFAKHVCSILFPGVEFNLAGHLFLPYENDRRCAGDRLDNGISIFYHYCR